MTEKKSYGGKPDIELKVWFLMYKTSDIFSRKQAAVIILLNLLVMTLLT